MTVRYIGSCSYKGRGRIDAKSLGEETVFKLPIDDQPLVFNDVISL